MSNAVELQIVHAIVKNFGNWGLTNYKDDYAHLTKPGAQVKINAGAKDADARLHMTCQAFRGKRKSKDQVMSTGRRAFENGGGCCTTSAFAVAYKLHEVGVTERIEIIGQGSFHNGHMWVVVGREGGTSQGGGLNATKRPENSHATWGDYVAVDTWLKAFGWGSGVWRKPPNGKHHFFIESDISRLEITYDSLVEDGDD